MSLVPVVKSLNRLNGMKTARLRVRFGDLDRQHRPARGGQAPSSGLDVLPLLLLATPSEPSFEYPLQPASWLLPSRTMMTMSAYRQAAATRELPLSSSPDTELSPSSSTFSFVSSTFSSPLLSQTPPAGSAFELKYPP
ncbi:hypothetical protein D9613_010228 [Agrocybe pediades]|uniref:Uncharacterized protein n=1 Tax=Agrocybe pediades TaxID=84607 RepID=A0A8H4VHY6_9AGAR|nr:hypothetical protein D9613_010228 [Agrocybe pediades]